MFWLFENKPFKISDTLIYKLVIDNVIDIKPIEIWLWPKACLLSWKVNYKYAVRRYL